MVFKTKIKQKKFRAGKKFHIDVDFEGERLVDDVTVFETPTKFQKKVLVESPRLRANIIIFKKELKPR